MGKFRVVFLKLKVTTIWKLPKCLDCYQNTLESKCIWGSMRSVAAEFSSTELVVALAADKLHCQGNLSHWLYSSAPSAWRSLRAGCCWLQVFVMAMELLSASSSLVPSLRKFHQLVHTPCSRKRKLISSNREPYEETQPRRMCFQKAWETQSCRKTSIERTKEHKKHAHVNRKVRWHVPSWTWLWSSAWSIMTLWGKTYKWILWQKK